MEYFMNEFVLLFTILFVGYSIGKWSFKGISLGSTAILLISLLFGYFGFTLSREIMELGLILFVYSVGISVGARFFRSFRKEGWKFVLLGIAGPSLGALGIYLLAGFFQLPSDLATGLYTGALTNTPALAGVLDTLTRTAPDQMANVSSAYGIAYPFAMISVVLMNQILPRLKGVNLQKEEEQFNKSEETFCCPLSIQQFQITNPACWGKSIAEINPERMISANFSCIIRNKTIIPANSKLLLEEGDIARVVGSEDELNKMGILLGQKLPMEEFVSKDYNFVDVKILNKKYTGKKIQDIPLWSQYEVVITRVRRSDLEWSPKGSLVLEWGDNLRIAGMEQNLKPLVKEIQGDLKQLEETNLIPYFAGLLIGIAFGSIRIPLGSQINLSLGSAGGAFLISLLLGHVGRIRSIPFYVPPAVKHFSREFGLLLFLAGAGTMAGARIMPILQSQGISLLLLGALLTLFVVIFSFILARKIFKLNISASMGAVSAIMTNPPALSSAQAKTDSVEPLLNYASIYPIALISKIVLAQVLIFLLGK
jgi:putative transport protein